MTTGTNAISMVLGSAPARQLVGAVGKRRSLDRLAALFVVLTIAFTAVYASLRPDYNWDMVAYIAAAVEPDTQSAEELHERTWAIIEPGASEAQEFHLKQSNPYNEHQWENPEDFQSQLGMYRVKVAYIAVIRALAPVLGYAEASMILSVVPTVLVGGLLLFWLSRVGALQGAFFLIPALILADLFHMTTAVTPDMLLALLSLGALYLLSQGRDVPACALLFGSLFVRPDNIILIFALLIAVVLFRQRIVPLAVTFVAGLAACIWIAQYGGHPGWWAHFYFSCVQIQHSMIDFAPPFSLIDFMRGYVRGAVVALADNDWLPLFAILLAGWALLGKAGRATDMRLNALVFATAIGTLGKFASFPLPDDRFYFVFIGGMAVLLTVMWKPRLDLTRQS